MSDAGFGYRPKSRKLKAVNCEAARLPIYAPQASPSHQTAECSLSEPAGPLFQLIFRFLYATGAAFRRCQIELQRPNSLSFLSSCVLGYDPRSSGVCWPFVGVPHELVLAIMALSMKQTKSTLAGSRGPEAARHRSEAAERP